MSGYAHPEMLVDTAWVEAHRADPNVRIAEVDVDTTAYEQGHVPGAIAWNWTTQLAERIARDILSKAAFEELMRESGVSNNTTVILYGDNNNWFAAWALWQMCVYGHRDVRLMNGGRKKWLQLGLPLSRDLPKPARASYTAKDADTSLRALLPDVKSASERKGEGLVDVRSPNEFIGRIVAPPGSTETAQRPGHIPGASSIPWSVACNEDGTFKSADELKKIYGEHGITADKPAITYCRIGERSSHSWFVLKYLLGFPKARNYDGSWTEWGNLVGVPIQRGA